MVEVTVFELEEDKSKKSRGGIKSFTFTSTGKNGESHRKNRAKKKAQYVKNKDARATLNMERGRIGAKEYHLRLEALSKGLA